MAKWVCNVCGYVAEGDAAPEFCPVCKAPASKFTMQAGEKTWAAEHVVGVAIPHKDVAGRQPVGRDAVPHLADAVQVRTGDDGARFIDNAHHAVDRIFHLIDNALKNSVRHNTLFPSVLRRSACAQL